MRIHKPYEIPVGSWIVFLGFTEDLESALNRLNNLLGIGVEARTIRSPTLDVTPNVIGHAVRQFIGSTFGPLLVHNFTWRYGDRVPSGKFLKFSLFVK